MSGLLAPIISLFDPVWALIAARTWLCIGVLTGLAGAVALLQLPVLAAFLAGVLALILMWKSEHDQRLESKLHL